MLLLKPLYHLSLTDFLFLEDKSNLIRDRRIDQKLGREMRPELQVFLSPLGGALITELKNWTPDFQVELASAL